MAFNMRLLPGRIAVLVPDRQHEGLVVIHDAIQERLDHFHLKARLLCGTVVAHGRDKGRVPFPAPGETVFVKPNAGLTIESGDIDVPSLGVDVPAGHTLRLYGVWGPWTDNVLVSKE